MNLKTIPELIIYLEKHGINEYEFQPYNEPSFPTFIFKFQIENNKAIIITTYLSYTQDLAIYNQMMKTLVIGYQLARKPSNAINFLMPSKAMLQSLINNAVTYPIHIIENTPTKHNIPQIKLPYNFNQKSHYLGNEFKSNLYGITIKIGPMPYTVVSESLSMLSNSLKVFKRNIGSLYIFKIHCLIDASSLPKIILGKYTLRSLTITQSQDSTIFQFL